jgi:hypothetical protein
MQYPLFAVLALASSAQVNGDVRPLPEAPRVRYAHVILAGDTRQIWLEVPTQSAPADEDDRRPPVRPPRHADITTLVLGRENFDRWLFDDGGHEAVRQRHLDDLLRANVEALAGKYKLSEPQWAKLRLAGQGDIKRFFDNVEERRRDFETDGRNFQAGVAALHRLAPLSQLYRDGPFGDSSLFAKTLRKIRHESDAGK